jgi:hypothetical protein
MSQIHISSGEKNEVLCRRKGIRGRLTEKEYQVLKEKNTIRSTVKNGKTVSAMCQECEKRV